MRIVRLWFCDFWHPETKEAIRRNPIFTLLSRRFNIVLDSKVPEFLFFGDCGFRHASYKCPRIFYTAENIRPDLAACDFSFSYDPDSSRNLRLPYYALFDLSSLLAPEPAVPKTTFCNFIYSNPGCEARNRFFRLLSEYKHVDSAGRLFNNTPPPSPRGIPNWHDEKIPFMRRYKFTIAFENMSYRGYITEKLTDAFAARTVPIYWGCPDVAKEFNPSAFINCLDFSDFESVVRHVAKVDEDDALYDSYLNMPPFVGNKLPPSARWERALDFVGNIFDNPPQDLAARSRWSGFFRSAPHLVARKIWKYRIRKMRRPR